MRILVIGCGSIGSRHIGNLFEMGHEVWGYDVDESKFQFEWFWGHRNFGKYRGGFPAVVFICTPPSTHFELIRYWSNYHLFVEKPLCLTRGELVALRNLTFEKTTMVACNMRFEPLIERACGLLRELGELYSVKVDFGYRLSEWRPNVDYRDVEHPGVVLDCFHDLDILRWFHGELSDIKSSVRYGWETDPDHGNFILSTVDALGSFKDNRKFIMANLHFDYHRREKRRRIEWIGSRGTMTYVEDRSLKNPEGANYLYFNGEKYYNQYDHNHPYRRQLEHFFDCIDRGLQTCNPMREAAKTMEFAFRLEE